MEWMMDDLLACFLGLLEMAEGNVNGVIDSLSKEKKERVMRREWHALELRREQGRTGLYKALITRVHFHPLPIGWDPHCQFGKLLTWHSFSFIVSFLACLLLFWLAPNSNL